MLDLSWEFGILSLENRDTVKRPAEKQPRSACMPGMQAGSAVRAAWVRAVTPAGVHLSAASVPRAPHSSAAHRGGRH